MAYASVMTFSDPNEQIRIKHEDTRLYIYWQPGTYLALSPDEAQTVRAAIDEWLAQRGDDTQQVAA